MRDCYKDAVSLFNYQNERPFISDAINVLDSKWNEKNLFIIEAPTGYGKSSITASLALKTFRDNGKLLVVFPLRVLLEDQFRKLADDIIREDGSVLGKKYMHEPDSPYLIKPITLTTVDTLSLTMFGLAPEDLSRVVGSWNEWSGTSHKTVGHYLFSWSSVFLSDIILDEVHLLTDSTKSLTYLIALLEYAIRNEQRIILMSATLSRYFRHIIENSLFRYRRKIEWVEFDGKDKDFMSERLSKRYNIHVAELSSSNKFNTLLSWLEEEKAKGFRRALVVFNTVGDAITFYRLVEDSNKLLLHSRFSTIDKEEKQEILAKLRGANSYVIVGTQSIEAGLDISSDLLITELSPASSLIQRFGRFLRYDGEDEGAAYVWYEDTLKGKRRYKVYDAELCRRTLSFMKEAERKLNFHVPYGENGYKSLIDGTYDGVVEQVNMREVDRMLSSFLDFNSISDAISLFLRLEGSFVREALTIPVNTEGAQEEVIPISHSMFKRLLELGKVKGIIPGGHERIEEITQYEKQQLMDQYSAVKFLFKRNVAAFVIEGYYDSELGLVVEMDDEHELA